jgi:nucleotide-binding universal stress UspA family protein
MTVTSVTHHSDPLRRGPANEVTELDATPSRWTAIKQILACVDGTDKDQSVLNHALQVALHFGSHIDVLHVHFDVHGASTDKRYKPLVDRFLDIPVERAVTEAAVRAHRHFENWQTQCKLPLSDTGMGMRGPSTLWREILGYENEIIARLGRLSDLIVIARPSKLSSTFSLMALETALFDTCRPVLMVPDGMPMNLFHRPIIAWNGSLEAARAVGFALPFLTECEGGVDIFAAPERKHRTETEELQRYLSWHGVVAERVLVEDSRPIGMSLLAQASSNQAGLIVMGAYTHGHYRQFLFGGMTRYVMDHAATPVLLAH